MYGLEFRWIPSVPGNRSRFHVIYSCASFWRILCIDIKPSKRHDGMQNPKPSASRSEADELVSKQAQVEFEGCRSAEFLPAATLANHWGRRDSVCHTTETTLE